MKAMVLHSWVKEWGNNLKLEEREKPVPNRGEVVVKVEACGVGSTINNFLMGRMVPDERCLPRIPGHEVAGIVDKVGPGVSSFSEGDRVILYFYLTCDKCNFCIRGLHDLCDNFAGYIGIHIDGGYAEYVKVPENNLFRLPEKIGFIEGTVICDALCTPYHVANSRAKISEGDVVLIFGAGGGVGIHMVQVARLFGANVIGIDVGEEKISAMKSVGTTEALDASNPAWYEEVRNLTDGKGVDVVIDFVGAKELIERGISLLNKQGRFVELTTHPGIATLLENRLAVLKELTIMGSRYCTKSEFKRTIEILARGKVKPVITVIKKLEEVEEIHAMLAKGKLIGRAAITPS